MNEELKPCPFCGGKPKMWVQSAFHYGDRGYSEQQQHQITCTGCHAQKVSRGDALSSQDATTAWNTRTPSPREQKLVEALRFYAGMELYQGERDEDGYTPEMLDDMDTVEGRPFGEWSGKRAREALSAYNAPGSQGCEKAPVGEEELAELLHKEHDLWLSGEIPDKTLNVFQHQSRALAKRLGWML